MPLLLLWHPQGVAVAPPAYSPAASTPRAVIVLRDPGTGGRVRFVAEHGDVTLSFGPFGPTSAALVLRRGSGDVSAGTLLPGGDAALVEVDARALGVPDAWLGQAMSIDEDVTHAAAEGQVSIPAEGPMVWLSDIGIHDVPTRQTTAGEIVKGIVGQHPGRHRLILGTIQGGASIEYSAAGQSIGGMLDDLAKLTLERPVMTARPGEGKLTLDWLDPLSVPDARRVVTLLPGRNCAEVKLTTALRRTAGDVVAVGQAYVRGTAVQSTGMRAPSGITVGRRAALTMSAYAAPAAQLSGGPVTIRPDLASSSTILQAAVTHLRRSVPIVPGGSATITDSALFPALRPGAILSAVFADALGLWGRCLVQLRTVTWTLGRDVVRKVSISFDLWSPQ